MTSLEAIQWCKRNEVKAYFSKEGIELFMDYNGNKIQSFGISLVEAVLNLMRQQQRKEF